MIAFLASFILGLSVLSGFGLSGDRITTEQPQNFCCILPNGQQCCAPTADTNGNPNGCGCQAATGKYLSAA